MRTADDTAGGAAKPATAGWRAARERAADTAEGGRHRLRPGERLACVDLPAFPLQLLLRREGLHRPGSGSAGSGAVDGRGSGRRPAAAAPPAAAGPEHGAHEAAGVPAAVVDRDRPQGRLLWVNEAARQQRVLPGQRYAAALGLCPELRAAEVPPEEIAAGVDEVARLLERFSPEVEPAPHEPGVFWVNAAGLVLLHPSLLEWAERLHRTLDAEGFSAAVVCGFGRFGTYALARAAGEGAHLLADPQRERELAARVPLARLGIEPALRDALLRLGVRRVGDFLRLPPEGLATRFGKEAQRLHRLASGELARPLTPRPHDEPPVRRVTFEFPEQDLGRLLHVVEGELGALLAQVAERRQALAALHLRLHVERGPPLLTEVRPAAPTLEAAQLLELCTYRLRQAYGEHGGRPGRTESAGAGGAGTGRRGAGDAGGVEELVLTARGVPARPEQLRLFRTQPRRDLRAAARALARVRAALGPGAVVAARLGDGHLPEASFVLEPLEQVRLPAPPREARPARLVRRLLARPAALPPRPRHEPDGWLLAGTECGPVRRSAGPYVLSGAWWGAAPGQHAGVHREYHFAETARGDLLWVFHDRRRRRWFLQGALE